MEGPLRCFVFVQVIDGVMKRNLLQIPVAMKRNKFPPVSDETASRQQNPPI